jgi:hypothetical protein
VSLTPDDLVALRAALRSFLPDHLDREIPAGDHTALMEEIESAVRAIRELYDAEYGPLAHWKAPRGEELGKRLDVRVYALEDEPFGCADITNEARERLDLEEHEWHESAFYRAARSYKRDCGWDRAPGPAGVWVVAYEAVSWFGSGRDPDAEGLCTGNLVGFVVLHDQDGDERVESLAHVWTARSKRRSGVARRVLERARERYAISTLELPLTESGKRFFRFVAPDLLGEA